MKTTCNREEDLHRAVFDNRLEKEPDWRNGVIMSYRIVADSCTDLPEELKGNPNITLIPLTLQVGDITVLDDESFDQIPFLQMMENCPECPKSACPSPEVYMDAFDDVDEVYVITLSSHLSGSYNSAELAKMLYLEKHPNRKIEVFDSQSASIAQTLILLHIMDLKEKDVDFEEVVRDTNEYRDNLKTKFVLENIENLRKNGRMSNIAAKLINVLNIKLVLCGVEGMIEKLDQARGITKALGKMIKHAQDDVKDAKNRILGISHCNNYERAVKVKEEILKVIPFAKVVIVDMAGVSSMYANDGGIIIAY